MIKVKILREFKGRPAAILERSVDSTFVWRIVFVLLNQPKSNALIFTL